MIIDTRHTAKGPRVSFVLQSAEERALTDDMLARIGVNQHRLNWLNGKDGQALLGERDPATLRLDGRHRRYEVSRDPAPHEGVEHVVLQYELPPDDES